ncbi:MAG: TrkH family potassium uptake protein [Luteibaculaceae bacterium]
MLNRLKNKLVDLYLLAQRAVRFWFDIILPILALISLGLVVYHFGFPLLEDKEKSIENFLGYIPKIFFWTYLIRLLFVLRVNLKLLITTREALLQTLWIIILGFFSFYNYSDFSFSVYVNYTLAGLVFFLEFSKITGQITKATSDASLVFVGSFLIVIVLGTGLLMLPNATTSPLSFTDAVFTATSAVCVTGLVVVDTHEAFTMVGQNILLILIQIGGLGLMTFTTFFAFLFIGSAGFKNRVMLKGIFNSNQLNRLFNLVLKILFLTLGIEFLGFLGIYFLIPLDEIEGVDKWYFAIFHSISAFCHAGFTNIPGGLFAEEVREMYAFHLVISALVIFGGLGFPIMFNAYDIVKKKCIDMFRFFFLRQKIDRKPRIVNMHTKIVLIYSSILLILGFVSFLVLEFNNDTLKDLSWKGKLVTSFFASVTARSSGFNTFATESMLPGTTLIIVFLMWVGASPASTGGGIKTTTFAIALANISALAKGKDRIEIFGREIPVDVTQRAFAVIFLSLGFISVATVALTMVEPKVDLMQALFEVFSAFCTVGLSLGITSELSVAGKWILIVSMFIGRIGAITLIMSLVKKVKYQGYKLPKEGLIIN